MRVDVGIISNTRVVKIGPIATSSCISPKHLSENPLAQVTFVFDVYILNVGFGLTILSTSSLADNIKVSSSIEYRSNF